MTVPPGFAPFFEQLHGSGFTARGGQLVCTYFDENMLHIVPPAHVEGLYSCLDYFQDVADLFSRRLTAQSSLALLGSGPASGTQTRPPHWRFVLSNSPSKAK